MNTVHVYNYEGYSFRVFKTDAALNDFLNLGIGGELHFSSVEPLDEYLLKLS